MRPETREQLRTALEDVLTAIRSRPRRFPHESLVELLRGYPQLLVALAFARIEEAHRARELFDHARAAITSDKKRQDDLVHTFLLATFGLRLDEIVAGRPMQRFLCAQAEGMLVGVNRVQMYKINSFRQQLATDDAPSQGAVIAAFSRREAAIALPDQPAQQPATVIELDAIDAAFERTKPGTLIDQLATYRAIARAYARAPIQIATDGMRRLAALVHETTDTFGACTHFQLSLVNLVASICLVVEEFAETR